MAQRWAPATLLAMGAVTLARQRPPRPLPRRARVYRALRKEVKEVPAGIRKVRTHGDRRHGKVQRRQPLELRPTLLPVGARFLPQL